MVNKKYSYQRRSGDAGTSQWWEKHARAKSYLKKNGSFIGIDDVHPDIRPWLRRAKESWKNRKLDNDRIAAMKEIGVSLNGNIKFKETNKRTNRQDEVNELTKLNTEWEKNKDTFPEDKNRRRKELSKKFNAFYNSGKLKNAHAQQLGYE